MSYLPTPVATRPLPKLAIVLGVAGLIPFVMGGIAAASNTDDMQALLVLRGLIAYGAVILAFLGGVHWGLVLAGRPPSGTPTSTRREHSRLVAGVLPSLVGWAALLVSLIGLQLVALAILLLGFVGLTLAEAELKRRGLFPPGYLWLRLGLSVVVVLVLGTVLTLRVIGAHIII